MHGLRTIAFLHDNNAYARRQQNASDPGGSRKARAEDDLAEALLRVAADVFGGDPCADCPDKADCLDKAETTDAETTDAETTGAARRFPPDFSVIRHGSDAWVLPLTPQGTAVAARAIPKGTPRYGLHYILSGEEGLAIAASLEAACK